MEWLLLKTIFSLVAVLGLMFGTVWFLKKYVYHGRSGGKEQVVIEILGHRTLQPKRSVIVLKIMEKVIVVGMSEHGMQTLTEITGVADATEELGTAGESGSRLSETVSRIDARNGVRGFADHLQEYVQSLVQTTRKKGAAARMRPLE